MTDRSAPVRTATHEAMESFVGDWNAEGVSYGGTDQTGPDPKANGVSWISTHTGRWHSGGFFLIQDEKARLGDKDAFDTVSLMGIDQETGRCFARSFENHGFYRDYDVVVDGRVWSIGGATERARVSFSEDGRTQTIFWEWKPDTVWLPLCDRTAVRVGA